MNNFEWPERISSDEETVDRFMHEGSVSPEAPSQYDMEMAIQWLALYGASDSEEAQPYVNVIAFLERSIQAKMKRSATAEAKRAYAAEHGIPVSQVRVKK